MTLVHYLPPGPIIRAACGEADIRNGGSDVGKVTCFACRKTAEFRNDQLTDGRPSHTKGNTMADSIEWAHTSGPVYLIGGDEEAGDGNTPNDAPGDGFVAVLFEQCAIYGTPLELIDTFTSAIRTITEHLKDQADG